MWVPWMDKLVLNKMDKFSVHSALVALRCCDCPTVFDDLLITRHSQACRHPHRPSTLTHSVTMKRHEDLSEP